MTPMLLLISCYLMGTLPSGLIITKIFKRIDVREYGSGNAGVTNVLRTVGIWPALSVLTFDVGKGILAVLVTKAIAPSPELEVGAAISVMVGHNWPIFLKFKGGKGSATGIGSVFAISPCAGIIMLAIGLPFIAFFRYVSLGAIIGSLAVLITMIIMPIYYPDAPMGVTSLKYAIYPGLAVPIIIFRHRENISRLMKGEENKLGKRINTQDPSTRSS